MQVLAWYGVRTTDAKQNHPSRLGGRLKKLLRFRSRFRADKRPQLKQQIPRGSKPNLPRFESSIDFREFQEDPPLNLSEKPSPAAQGVWTGIRIGPVSKAPLPLEGFVSVREGKKKKERKASPFVLEFSEDPGSRASMSGSQKSFARLARHLSHCQFCQCTARPRGEKVQQRRQRDEADRGLRTQAESSSNLPRNFSTAEFLPFRPGISRYSSPKRKLSRRKQIVRTCCLVSALCSQEVRPWHRNIPIINNSQTRQWQWQWQGRAHQEQADSSSS